MICKQNGNLDENKSKPRTRRCRPYSTALTGVTLSVTVVKAQRWFAGASGSSACGGTASEVTPPEGVKCLSCGESLETRAALARHHREVHSSADGSSEASVGSNSTAGGAKDNDASIARVACEKCGRTFKNKSNLKIHMLTHSGLKPFG